MKVSRVRALVLLLTSLYTGPLGPKGAWGDELYDYGEYLSSECATCHQLSGKSAGIPSITGWPVDNFITALESYKNGLQENAAMLSVAKRLSDEDIKALAVFFHKQGH
jgi:cytochrome c553